MYLFSKMNLKYSSVIIIIYLKMQYMQIDILHFISLVQLVEIFIILFNKVVNYISSLIWNEFNSFKEKNIEKQINSLLQITDVGFLSFSCLLFFQKWNIWIFRLIIIKNSRGVKLKSLYKLRLSLSPLQQTH